ncbi:YraN family protein [Candidatus Peregrinibacteria bacterium]|jgi:putative endonuclease|nr:YraN family protein [Candidatus Peregrinibacteria bacterium]
MKTREFGNMGEGLVEKHLILKGWKILEKNFTIRGGEIDLIAVDQGCLVFIEVKTRTSKVFGEGVEQFGFKKRKRVKKTAMHFLEKTKIRYGSMRFDFISLEKMREGKWKLKHFKNVEM